MSDKKYTVEFTEDELMFLLCFHGQSSPDDWKTKYLVNHDKEMINFITQCTNINKDTNAYILYRKLHKVFLDNYEIPALSARELKQNWIDAINSGDTELSLKEWIVTNNHSPTIKTKFGVIYND